MEGQAIATDVPCVRCGYNLRMQSVEGVCPECGLTVKASLEQTILKWGPRRLRRIAWGMRIAGATAIAVAVTFAVYLMLGMRVVPIIKNTEFVQWVVDALLVIVCVIHAAGAWMATSAPLGEKFAMSRRVCRITSATIPWVWLGLFFHDHLSDTGRKIGSWLLLISPILMASWAIYAERAAACWTNFHRRGGLRNWEAMGKWSMRCFVPVACILAACLAVTNGLNSLRELNFITINWTIQDRIGNAVVPVAMGTLGIAGILLILISIALFRGANRTMKLTRLAKAAEAGGFTAPLASATDAPSCS
jgi:hypothetical protein